MLAVITPTWRPDAPLFADLHRSVLEFTPDDTVHHLIVPALHRSTFARYESRRCRIWTHPELLPRRYVRFPPGIWLNAKRPWPPVRGWVMQQAAKIAAAATIDADVVLIADSDSVLVRPTTEERLRVDGRPYLYRAEGAIHGGMRRHVLWHQVARDLLGLPPPTAPPLPDYVSAIGVWDPPVVRAMQQRITDVTGRHWLDAFTSRLHISEFIVYGVFVDEGRDVARPPTDATLCHTYYEQTPLDLEAALAFADNLKPEAIGMMIAGNSGTPHEVRRAAIRRCAEIVAQDGTY
ncbi:MAG TPA: DUF6492 family protein [Actinophytocola sp.]|uniref:DUF6492 family protein n=1 Tax=Actinophytocola sp. TaxID=1872138 RepID=UPI002DDD35F0|nr:DUF6492 family protein [Actinophytocola sp.]HEV2779864.1 DUF6492 family protein [Actinophytocola sp.]